MGEFAPESPSLVQTDRGFSVSYKNRLLYSKYDPKRAVVQTVSDFEILPGTLVLALSPALWYGTDELLKKLPENSFVLAVETDKTLYDFSKSRFKETENIAFLPQSEISNIVEIISGTREVPGLHIPRIHNFKRARSIEMSGGVNLNRDFYKQIAAAAENAVAAFWKNRITLTKMGRLYSKNIFKNIPALATATTIQKYSGAIAKPIFVFGAGESAQTTLQKIDKSAFKKFFLLAVDAASPLLQAFGIVPDGIVALESQLAIEKSYIGGGASDSVIFADISSRKEVTAHTQKEVSYFATEFSPTIFFKRLESQDFFPPKIPALGSVGLAAVHLATLFRTDDSIPIFFSGLDFSFSLGKTHANGTHAHTARLSSSTRIFPAENYDAAFKDGSFSFVGKNGEKNFSDKALSGYAMNFSQTFAGTKNLYDAGESGIDLGLLKISSGEIAKFAEKISVKEAKTHSERRNFKESIRNFLEDEENALNRIKELLMFGNDVAKCGVSINSELEELISCREYLFLHFPDGFKCSVDDLSFLKRVRSEIDFFLKTIKLALKT